MRTIEAARNAVVVGVDDSAISRSAVLWAAEEARLRRLHLLIVHVAGRKDDGPDAALIRELLLNGSAEAASQREPTVIVGTLLLCGRARKRLIDLTRDAAMLVLGTTRGGPPSPDRKFGAVTHRLASRGLCDVVAVSRAPRIGDTRPSQILAAWTSEAAGAGVLSAAAKEADLRTAGLTLALPTRMPLDSVSRSDSDGSISGDLAELARRYPALDVTVDQIDPTSAAAVTTALTGCHLAVLGYRRHGVTKSAATALADALIRQATCPLFFSVDQGNRRHANAMS